MQIEDIRTICSGLPAVTEDIKWEHDLCFCVGGKMFLVVGLNSAPTGVSFKVPDEDFAEISSREGFMPAPYVARYKWVMVKDINLLSRKEWEHFARQSYRLVSERLPKKVRKELGIGKE
jgi:predicted DNA-binding protein (MmcQ/YjbR family)